MASTAASTISHNLHPIPIVSVPRIRPPRIPKGTPNANTNSQPDGPVPKGKVWVQGKWRETASHAVKNRQQILSRKVEKALRHETHGTSIYAYNHIRTKQVVYSLTRIMNNNNIMKQLQYFGKKTVPRALRRDLWTPYYSIHFPPTEAGAEAGKLAYHRLRELALQRQLSPPDELVRTSQEDIDRFAARFNPMEFESRKEDNDFKHPIPILGQRLPKRLRGQRLMDQKATSVADVAFVLGLHIDSETPEEMRKRKAKTKMKRVANLGRRAKTRLSRIRDLEARKAELIETLAKQVARLDGNQGQLLLDQDAMMRVSMEHQGVLTVDSGVHGLQNIEEARAAKSREFASRKELEGVDAEIQALHSESTDTITGDAEKLVATESVPISRPKVDAEGVTDVPAVSSPELSLSAAEDPFTVRINWADMRDGTYAEEWPENVFHGELARMALARAEVGETKQGKYINGAGVAIDGPVTKIESTRVIARSVHVMGGAANNELSVDPKQLIADKFERWRVEAEARKEIEEAEEARTNSEHWALLEEMNSEHGAMLAAEGKAERVTAHEQRKAEWADLSPEEREIQQREAAETKAQRVAAYGQRKAAWAALSPEEREIRKHEAAERKARNIAESQRRRVEIDSEYPALAAEDRKVPKAADRARPRAEEDVELPPAGLLSRIRSIFRR